MMLGVYVMGDGQQPIPLGGSPLSEDWIAAARACVDGDVLQDHVAWPLDGDAGTIGALVAKAPARYFDADFIAALAQVVALALARIQLAAKLAEVQAQSRADELKSALLASVSHDLRTPLTAISSSAASLLAYGDSFDAETTRDLLNGIASETNRLNTLTTNLLEMSRLDAGNAKLNCALLPVAEMVRDAIARHIRSAGVRQLRFTAPRHEMLVEADAVLFDVLLTNVLQNAIRYTAEDGVIVVACAADAGECTITVTDNGVGIPSKDQARVFERFYRVRRLGEVPRGSGLGLAIAKSFVEAAHGSIGVASPVSEGRGTTVTIRLPLAPAGPSDEAMQGVHAEGIAMGEP